jgi:hypothetical protein
LSGAHGLSASDDLAVRAGLGAKESDPRGAPTRARFHFDRELEHPTLSFLHWSKKAISAWTPPPVAASVQLEAAAVF